MPAFAGQFDGLDGIQSSRQPRRRLRRGGGAVTIRRTIVAVALAATAMLGGCTVYQPAPGVYAPAPPSAFERSWNAALGAFQDQGLTISSADRPTGMIRGHRAGTEL